MNTTTTVIYRPFDEPEIRIRQKLQGTEDREPVEDKVLQAAKKALDLLPIGDAVERFGLEPSKQLQVTLRDIIELFVQGAPESFRNEEWFNELLYPLESLHLWLQVSLRERGVELRLPSRR